MGIVQYIFYEKDGDDGKELEWWVRREGVKWLVGSMVVGKELGWL